MITNPAIKESIRDTEGVTFFQAFLPKLITMGLIIGVLIFVLIFIVGGIQWISSGGDKNALEEAKHKVTNAIIGLVILFALFAVLKIVGDFLGISILTLDIGSLTI